MNRQLVLANLNSGDRPLNRLSRQPSVESRSSMPVLAMISLEIVASISDAGTRVIEPTDLSGVPRMLLLAFDILELNGEDLRDRPLIERKKRSSSVKDVALSSMSTILR